MMEREHQSHASPHTAPFFKWILIGFLLVAGYFLVMEHRAHLGGFLNYLPLLLFGCLFMHLFMHHGHDGHGEHSSRKKKQGEQE